MSAVPSLALILLIALVISATPGSGQETREPEPERVVLENVPYIGPDWQNRLDGPQDFMFPSAMGSVTKYLGGDPAQGYRFYLCVCGLAYRQLWHPTKWDCAFDSVWAIAPDPAEPVRRSFEAAGYEFRLVGNQQVCEARLQLEGIFAEQVPPDELRRQVCASLQDGRLAIAFGLWSAAAVVAGYEEHGEVLVGWTMLEDEGAVERDDLGYVRFRNWLDHTEAVLFVGEKREALPLDEVCRKALLWAVEGSRTPRQAEFHAGQAAFTAWAEALQRDEELQTDQIDALKQPHETHFFISLAVAEGRAFGGAVFDPLSEAHPQVAQDLQAARDCYGLMHDLVWRLWQTEGSGTDEEKLLRFARPEVRRELARIILLQRDQDAKAVAHLERALLAMGVKPEDIPQATEAEKATVARLEARERASGADRSMLRKHIVDLWADGVPHLKWRDHRDCTFIGALEAALAPTARPYSYVDLMGYSALAFRTRWFDNPRCEETRWGTGRWHPVSPHGEQAEEIAGISRATGWQLRAEELPEDPNDVTRKRLITDIVLSINEGLPAVIGCNTDLATVYGYNIHSMNLFLRDYQRPDEDDLRVPATDPSLHSPVVFLEKLGEPLPPHEALLRSIGIALRNGRREPVDGFRYGLDALDAWQEALAGYEACADEERNLLFLVNWWSLMHLADARRAAAEFLAANADLLTGNPQAALLRALLLYENEAEALRQFVDQHSRFIAWWGGPAGVNEWDAETRQAQQDLLLKALGLEEEALKALAEVRALEGREG